MSNKVLLTRGHRHALDQAEERGVWRPLPLLYSEIDEVTCLACIGYGETSLKALVEVRDFRGWPGADGVIRMLPVLGDYQELLSPLPLGVDEELLGWLPMHEADVQILDLNTFLAISRLSDIRAIPGACTQRPLTPSPPVRPYQSWSRDRLA
jgi:hypothetical protein